MATPKWAVGMQKLGPGIYVDAGGAMHVDQRGLCEEPGVPFTEANCKLLQRVVVQTLAPHGAEITEVSD